MSTTNPVTAAKLKAVPDFAPKSGPLGEVNQDFHNTYNALVVDTQQDLGTEIPVIIAAGDGIKLLNNGTEHHETFIPGNYHKVKALSHIAFGLQLALMANGDGPLTDTTTGRLRRKLTMIETAEDDLPNEDLPTEIQIAPGEVLKRCRVTTEQTLSAGKVDEQAVTAFAHDVAPWLMKNAAYVSRLQLDSLHQVVSSWREQLGESKWQSVYVIVCGTHQPRYREASKQYSQRILHQVESEDADGEDRVLYAEGVFDTHGAKDLLARQIIDQRASTMFFGDRHRLQEDLLADAATAYLKELLPD